MRKALLIIFSLVVVHTGMIYGAHANGFMQWARPLDAANSSVVGSAAGINVISFLPKTHPAGVGGHVDIVDSTTGKELLTIDQEAYMDVAVVLTPAETSEGLYTCEPLYRSAGEGSAATQPMWCGVLMLSSISASNNDEARIVLPNGTTIPLVPPGTPLPWTCTPLLPCVVRSQELRFGQLGGCHRRRNSSAT
eukprot:PhF_6_TR3587/c0_g1_i1/m.5142